MDENKIEKATPRKSAILLASILAALVILLLIVSGIQSATRLRKAKKLQTTIAAGYTQIVAVRTDGTVTAIGEPYIDGSGYESVSGQLDVWDWKNIISVSAGAFHTVGLKKDGTVVAAGANNEGQCDVSGWKNIIAIATGRDYTVGLMADGRLVTAGSNDFGARNVEDMTDIVAVCAGMYHTVGLKKDGTVVATRKNTKGECQVSQWQDITAIAAGGGSAVAGSVIANFTDGGNNPDTIRTQDPSQVQMGPEAEPGQQGSFPFTQEAVDTLQGQETAPEATVAGSINQADIDRLGVQWSQQEQPGEIPAMEPLDDVGRQNLTDQVLGVDNKKTECHGYGDPGKTFRQLPIWKASRI